jgi:hypothetical protein
VVVDALITIFGETTAPLLLSFAADGAIGLLIIRSCIEMRAAMVAAPAGRRPSPFRPLRPTSFPRRPCREGGH